MDTKIQLSVPKKEKTLEFDWFYFEEDTVGKITELPPLGSCFQFDSALLLCHDQAINSNHIVDATADNIFWDLDAFPSLLGDVVAEPMLMSDTRAVGVESSGGCCHSIVTSELSELPLMVQQSDNTTSVTSVMKEEERRVSGKKRSTPIEWEEIQNYFDVPISKAAKEMKVGLTILKKRCRELNIMRWPHRKIKSLKCLIDNVKEMGLNSEVVMLEVHKRLVEKLPSLELTDRTKKLRQACFKANYKKKKFLTAHA